MKLLLSLFFLGISITVSAQMPALERVEPMFWWAGMKEPRVQLLVHGNNIAAADVSLSYAGVKLEKVNKVENPNYLFLDLEISASAKPGKFPITFSRKGQKSVRYDFELKPRNHETKAQGVTSKDFIYLLMPDRFANGDPKNDRIKSMRDQTFSRDSIFYRHGGDLQGVIDHLDYLKDLGITTLWMTPVLENDEDKTSYHGYANTENYRVDRR
ncbi:MAG: cyclomaltodextrinase N-terminal domain-containing protein, partial [Mucilaginibacter polytrichastri]|nr:cyclomaltodextrinase N-terminal domain-containing protein [Mucilaginibacter polytrichastri]